MTVVAWLFFVGVCSLVVATLVWSSMTSSGGGFGTNGGARIAALIIGLAILAAAWAFLGWTITR